MKPVKKRQSRDQGSAQDFIPPVLFNADFPQFADLIAGPKLPYDGQLFLPHWFPCRWKFDGPELLLSVQVGQ